MVECPCKKGHNCICEQITPVQNSILTIILQHPQEPRELLGTAYITHKTLQNSILRVGLSWPNLGAVLRGHPLQGKLVPSRCATLVAKGAKDEKELSQGGADSELVTLGGKTRANGSIEALIVLDGTWSQAKALWWRNPWLLKTKKMALKPKEVSRYGKLRREPRAHCVSTIEASQMALDYLGESLEVTKSLEQTFDRLLSQVRN